MQSLYFKIARKPLYHYQCRDESGIPTQYRKDGSIVYNPLFIARHAQELHALNAKSGFIKATDWLVNHAKITDSTFAVCYTFDLEEYRQTAPWLSALSQAVIMNVMLDRYFIDQDSLYLDYAQKALYTLKPGVKYLTQDVGERGLWLLEYPSSDPPFVLNGMISILLELYDYAEKRQDDLALELFHRGYLAVLQKLPEFDYKGFSYYDLQGNPTGRLYHQKHIYQLAELNEIAPDEVLQFYHRRWSRMDLLPVPIQMMLSPKPKRILAFLLAWMLLTDLLVASRLWNYLRWHREKGHSADH